MTRKPKMILEVLEAIAEYFKDDPEIVTDCYLYLASSLSDAREQDRARTAIEQMGRCPKCGLELVPYKWDERHSELEESPKEHFCNYLCPECDFNG